MNECTYKNYDELPLMLNVVQVAAVLGTTQQVYARYEKGINELPVRHLRALCLLYEVSADYILDLPEGLKRPR